MMLSRSIWKQKCIPEPLHQTQISLLSSGENKIKQIRQVIQEVTEQKQTYMFKGMVIGIKC